MRVEGIEANAVSIRMFKASNRAALPVITKRIKQFAMSQKRREEALSAVIGWVRNP
jgi:hypothetical protein